MGRDAQGGVYDQKFIICSVKERSAIGNVVQSDKKWEFKMMIRVISVFARRIDKQCDHVISVITMENV